MASTYLNYGQALLATRAKPALYRLIPFHKVSRLCAVSCFPQWVLVVFWLDTEASMGSTQRVCVHPVSLCIHVRTPGIQRAYIRNKTQKQYREEKTHFRVSAI